VSTSVAVNTPRPVLSDFLNPPGVVPSPLSTPSRSKLFGTLSGYAPGSDTPRTNCSDASGDETPGFPESSEVPRRRVPSSGAIPFPDLYAVDSSPPSPARPLTRVPLETSEPELVSELKSKFQPEEPDVPVQKAALTDTDQSASNRNRMRATGVGVLVIGCVVLLVKAWRRFKLRKNRA
jgi:hypothetical protein